MPQMCPLIGRGHKTARPVGGPADGPSARIEHHDITWQIRVLAAKAIAEPRADRRITLDDPPAVHLNHRRAMRERIGIKALDDRQLVEVLIDMLKAVGAPQPRLAVLLERPLTGQQLLLLNAAAANFDIDRLAV